MNIIKINTIITVNLIYGFCGRRRRFLFLIMLIKTRNNIPINYLIIHGLIYHDDEGQGEGADQRLISVKLRWF